ncbi:MAG: hypothetical protein LBT36_01680, partial [Oscillospiraceae bacterium]|nr:hypothetical protein [Oscillospiraceae bacterium]
SWEPHAPQELDSTLCGVGEHFHDYWQWSMGGQKWYMPTPVQTSGYVASDPAIYNAADAVIGAKQTPMGYVITMQRWYEIGKPINQNYWVIDTDGWAYWAQLLAPGQATGLLLDTVQLGNPIPDDYYYAINVTYQMASATDDDGDHQPDYKDFGRDSTGNDRDHSWTPAGEDLVETIVGGGGNGGIGVWGVDNGVTIEPQAPYAAAKIGHRIFVPQGATLDLKAIITTTDTAAGSDIVWVEQPAKNGFSFQDTNQDDEFATIDIASTVPAGTTYPVRAEAKDDGSYYSNKTIVVIPLGSTIVDGGNGKIYINYGDNTFHEILSDGTLGNLFCGGEDGIPGNGDDRADVTIIDGEKLLPSLPGDLGGKGSHGGESGWYWTKGPDGKLGTSDDAETNLGGTPTPTQPTIDSLSVTPINLNLALGSAQQFAATATLSDGSTRPLPNSQITWELSPTPSSLSTVLTDSGHLTIGSNETATTLYVYATLKANTDVYNSATVTVVRPPLPNLKNLNIGDVVNLDGYDMMKMFYYNNNLGNPNWAMFMTVDNIGANAPWNSPIYTNATKTELDLPNSTMQAALDAWYLSLPLNGDIRSRISTPTYLTVKSANMTVPTINMKGETGLTPDQLKRLAFPPSMQELYELAASWYYVRGQSLLAKDSLNAIKTLTPGPDFWLRTQGSTGSRGWMAYKFSKTGPFSQDYIDYSNCGYRACVWIYVGN